MIISSEALNTYETKRRERIGERHGQLTIIDWVSRDKGYRTRCDCGNELDVKYYRLINGVTRSCRSCFVSNASGRPALPDNLGAKRAVQTQYRLEAKRRNLAFDLTEQEFISLITSECYYCGIPPSAKVSITTSSAHDDFRFTGIDRVDNKEGYTVTNCVPCCKQCNTSKLDNSLDDWFSWLEQAYKFQKNKGTFND